MIQPGPVAGKPVRERALLAVTLLVGFFASYFLIGLSVDPARARSVRIPFDDAIPFVPESIFLYAWVYTAMLFPLFVVRCPVLFRRAALAYALVLAVSFVTFALYPVTAIGLRSDLSGLDPGRFAHWGIVLTYTLDPPYNLFPSVHLAIATLAALVSWKARTAYGAVAFGFVALIAVAICTTKQHFVVDGFVGVALALFAYALVVHPYRSASGVAVAYGWRGPASYLVLHSLVYLGLFGAFLAGFDIEGGDR